MNPAVAADTRLRQALARAERRILVIEAVAETIGNAELGRAPDAHRRPRPGACST